MTKKLYKSRRDVKVDGVCSGIGEFFGIDATMVRLAFVLFTLLGGSGILLYIVCMCVMPREPEGAAPKHVDNQQVKRDDFVDYRDDRSN